MTADHNQTPAEGDEPLYLLHCGQIDSSGEQDEWDIEADSYKRVEEFCRQHPGQTVKLYPHVQPKSTAARWCDQRDTPSDCHQEACKDGCQLLAPAPAHQDYVLELLVAAGHITQSKVDEAREIAAKVAPAPEPGTRYAWISDKLRALGHNDLADSADWANHEMKFLTRELAYERARRASTQAPAVGDADLASLLPGTYYMDPPDGGSVTVLEQLQRMAKDAARYRFIRDADRSDHAIDFTMLLSLALDSMDAAIDAAMRDESCVPVQPLGDAR